MKNKYNIYGDREMYNPKFTEDDDCPSLGFIVSMIIIVCLVVYMSGQ